MTPKTRTILWITVIALAAAMVLSISVGDAGAAPRRPRRTPTPTPIRTPTPVVTPIPTSQPGAGGTLQVVGSQNVNDLNNRLNAVAAVSANNIWAVGESYTRNGSGRQTLIQHWDGASWQIVSSPNAGSSSNRLLGVAAASANDIWAVGRYDGMSGPDWQPLVLHYDGAAWTVIPVPSMGQGAAQLNAVAARAANDVWAVGSFTNSSTNWWDQPLVMHWDGSSWSIIPSPQIGTSTVLNGVTAIAPDDIWAVGYTYSSGYNTLTLHWDGSSWSVIPSNAGAPTRLFAVAAVSSNDVWAVGSRNNGAATLIMRWDGSTWNVVPSPNGSYSGANQHNLVGLAISSANDVWAVGSSASSGLCGGSDASDYRTYSLAMRWNGSTWQQALTVNPGPFGGCNTPRNDLYGVTAANGQAIAVGAYYDPALSVQFFRTLVEQGQ